jgi:2-amino-4-hydroxy-6-hydroxymethyldihydropteridine diphosphokinase
MNTVYLAFGSNLGDRGHNIQSAITQLERLGVKMIRSSKLYETEPVGKTDQPEFYNLVAEFHTTQSPGDLVLHIHSVERALKRVRKEKWGPRTIDIDVLFYGDQVIDLPGLNVPHPRIQERNFVLIPLNEIAPDFAHPIYKKSVRELLKASLDKAIVRPL